LFLFVTLIWLGSFASASQTPAPDCATEEACHAQALIAEASGDFERFHDLAWLAVQKSKPNNPELMAMLARAMALSGRPGDAIVMLSRLADMKIKVDVSGDDFRVVRTLKDWPDVQARLDAIATPVVTDAAAAKAPTSPAGASPAARAPDSTLRTSGPPPRATEPEKPKTAEPATPESKSPEAGTLEPKTLEPRPPETPAPESVLSFSAPAARVSGLAHDAVSRRFVVSERGAGGLMVIDEVSRHVVPLVSTAGAGFYDDLTAFRIDPRRGDLWVASARQDNGRSESILHKLQLVSGRPIFQIEPGAFGEVRFVDLVVDSGGTVYILDSAGSRIFRVRAGSRELELVTSMKVAGPTAFDVVDGRTALVAGSGGLARVDLATGRATDVRSKTPLGTIDAVDAHGRSIYVLQQSPDGGQLVRCTVDGKDQRISTAVVDSALAIGRDGGRLYYLAAPGVIKSIQERR
jgi:hypothetical protein